MQDADHAAPASLYVNRAEFAALVTAYRATGAVCPRLTAVLKKIAADVWARRLATSSVSAAEFVQECFVKFLKSSLSTAYPANNLHCYFTSAAFWLASNLMAKAVTRDRHADRYRRMHAARHTPALTLRRGAGQADRYRRMCADDELSAA